MDFQKAATLKDAFAVASPDTPLAEDDPRYVNLSPFRGETIIRSLAREISWMPEGEWLKLLLTGHRGCGKTTELYRLKRRLEKEGYFVLYWEAESELNPHTAEWVDIILTHVRKLAEEVPKSVPGIKVNEVLLNTIADSISTVMVEKVERKEKEKELETKIGVGLDLPFFLKALLRFKNIVRGGTEEITRVRHKIELRAAPLLNDVNLFIADIQHQLKQRKKKGLVILVDGLEKLVLHPINPKFTKRGKVGCGSPFRKKTPQVSGGL